MDAVEEGWLQASRDIVVSRTTAGIGEMDPREHGGHESLENFKANRNSACVPSSASAIFDQNSDFARRVRPVIGARSPVHLRAALRQVCE